MKSYRLETRRAVVGGNVKTHSCARHQDFGEMEVENHLGEKISQGSRFPKYVTAGDISRIEKDITHEWHEHCNGRDSAICDVVEVRIGVRVLVDYPRLGLKKVGAFIRDNCVASAFPEETKAKSFILEKDGKRVRKAERRLR